MRDTYRGTRGEVPLGIFVRDSCSSISTQMTSSRSPSRDSPTSRGAFDMAYPFGKYDQTLRARIQHGRHGERRLRDLQG
ncbi:MAG: hypothetical protein WKF82_10685 [Nocardioidaceae bacterium]